MATPTVYVFCDQNCKFEGMTKEQIISAIAEATGKTVTDVDEAFITKIKDQNSGNSIKFWVGSQAEYNEIVANDAIELDTFYFTDDSDLLRLVQNQVNQLAIAVDDTEAYARAAVEQLNSQYIGLENFVYNECETIRNETRPIDRGGTGATTAKAARTNLGLGAVATKDTVPIANGGTGATTVYNARRNLGFNFEFRGKQLDNYGGTMVSFPANITASSKIFAQVVQGNRDSNDFISGNLNVTVVNSYESAEIRVLVTSDSDENKQLNAGKNIDIFVMWLD